MRLLIFAYTYMPTLGGEQIEFELLLRELDKRKGEEWEIHFVAPSSKSQPHANFENITTHYLDLNFDGIQGKKPKRFFRNTIALTKIVQKVKPDILHVLSIVPGGLMTLPAKSLRRKRTKLIISSQGADLTVLPEINYGTRLNPVMNFLSKLIVKFENLHHVPSKAMIPFCKDLGLDANKVAVIPNSLPEQNPKSPNSKLVSALRAQHSLTPKDTVFLSLSGFRKVKGMKYLIEGFIEACKINPQIKLLLASKQNTLSEEYTQLIKNNGLEKNIIFLGPITGEKKEAYFSVAQGFVMPSLFESFGIALIEAMQRGKICIATNVGGMKDIIDRDINGYLIKPRSARAISEKVLWVAENLHDLTPVCKKAKEKAATYDISRVLPQFSAMYENVLNPH